MIYKCTHPGCHSFVEVSEDGNITTSGGEFFLTLIGEFAPRHVHGRAQIEMRIPVEIGSMAISEKDYNQQKRQSGAMAEQ